MQIWGKIPNALVPPVEAILGARSTLEETYLSVKTVPTKKKKTTAQWKKKLWPVFAAWVKERDGYRCFTCQKQLEPHTSNCQAGHFIPKSICGLDLYFDPLNVHTQCFHCNINLGGYGAMYHKRMVEVYGQEVVDTLWKRKGNITKDINWEELWVRYNNRSTK